MIEGVIGRGHDRVRDDRLVHQADSETTNGLSWERDVSQPFGTVACRELLLTQLTQPIQLTQLVRWVRWVRWVSWVNQEIT